jgi:SH3-like domain-containing protein
MRAAALLLCVSFGVALTAGAPGARAQAGDGLGEVTNLPVPRYVSLRSSEINVRRGPGLDYRKDWVFHRAGLPVRIIEEYGDWRRIVDKDDAGGWVYHAMLTGRRTVQVTAEEVVLREEPSDAAAPIARAEQGVVAQLEACQPDWCEVEAEGHAGWVPKSAIWGVDPGEVVEP